MYQTLLLDADGTLFDFDAAERRAFEKTCGAMGLAYTEGFYRRYQAANAACWRKYEKGEITKPQLQYDRFAALVDFSDPAAANEAYVGFLAQGSQLMPESVPVLTALKAMTPARKCCIITNGIDRVQRQRLRDSAIAPLIDGIVTSEEAGAVKPAAGFFEYAFRKLGLTEKGDALVVGDSMITDIAGGANYGLDTCLVDYEGSYGGEAPRPTHVIRRLTDLLALV